MGEFESNKVLFVRDIPLYSTENDIRRWIELSLLAKERKNGGGIQCVLKEMNAGSAYVRFGKDCDLKECVKRIRNRSLMGSNPKLIILNDENAKKIWNKIAWKIGDDIAEMDKEKAIKNEETNTKTEEEDEDEDDDLAEKLEPKAEAS